MDLVLQLGVNALITGSIYSLVAVGLSLSYLSFRVLNFSFGQSVMLGAYIYYFANVESGLSTWPSILVLCAAVVPLSYVIYTLFIKPFQGKAALLGLTATLSLGLMLESAIAMIFGVDVKSISHRFAEEQLFDKVVHVTVLQAIMISVSLSLLSLTALLLQQTPMGRRLKASFESKKRAQSVGISTAHEGFFSFSISIFLGLVAGVFFAFESNIQPWMGQLIGIKGFAAMVIGGLTNLWGALLGAYLLAFIEHFGIGLEFGSYNIPSGYKDAFSFLIILIVLLFFPTGIFSRTERRV